MSEVIWRGPLKLVTQKKAWKFNKDGVSTNLRYEGPLELIKSTRPSLGDTVAGHEDFGVFIQEMDIEELDGTAGALNLTLRSRSTDSRPSQNQNQRPAYKSSASYGTITVNRPIERHPRCGRIADGAKNPQDSTKLLTWEDWPLFVSANYVVKAATETAGLGPGWTFEQYMALKSSGTNDYKLSAPTIKLTRKYKRFPTDWYPESINRIQPPPKKLLRRKPFAGWQWFLDEDSVDLVGSDIVRTNLWIGINDQVSLTALIYGAAYPGTGSSIDLGGQEDPSTGNQDDSGDDVDPTGVVWRPDTK
jgi:hypothetical protein